MTVTISVKAQKIIDTMPRTSARNSEPVRGRSVQSFADFAYGALGIAYYFANRPSDSLTALKKMKEPWKTSLAVANVRLGRLEEARAIMATFRKGNPNWTIEKEAVWPTTKKPQYAEPFLRTYLADLAMAGLPAK